MFTRVFSLYLKSRPSRGTSDSTGTPVVASTFSSDEKPAISRLVFSSTWNWAGDAPGAGYGATGAPLRTLLRSLHVV